MNLSDVIRQKSYERIEYKLRRHPITFVPIFVLFVVLLSAPIGLYFLLNALFPTIIYSTIGFPIIVLFGSSYYLSNYLFFYVQFIDYYLDVWIITNDRIVDIEQHGLFTKTITELDLFRIQDVTVEINGIFPTLFDYGNLTVQTASSNTHIIFYNIAHPNEIRRELIHLSDEDRKFHNGQGDEI